MTFSTTQPDHSAAPARDFVSGAYIAQLRGHWAYMMEKGRILREGVTSDPSGLSHMELPALRRLREWHISGPLVEFVRLEETCWARNSPWWSYAIPLPTHAYPLDADVIWL